MLNTPAGRPCEVGYDFTDVVTPRIEAGRQYNRMLMGRAYYHDGFRLYSPQDWMTLLQIWETLQVRMRKDPPDLIEMEREPK